MTAIFLRELISYFISPIGYVYLAVFYLLAGYQYAVIILNGQADLSYEFSFLYTVILLLTPILTMRLMSEERKQKTDQILFSSPVTSTGIVAGKYFAAVVVYLLGIMITMLHALALDGYTEMNWAIVMGNMLGITLMGMAAIALCMFISAQTENQIVAAIGGFAAMLLVISVNAIAGVVNYEPLSKLLYSVSFYSRYYNLTMGILRVADLIFFISFIAIFVFLTNRVLEKRRVKTAALSTVVTVLGIVLIVAANFVTGQLTEKYGWDMDLTADDRYAISEESLGYVKALKEDVKITVMVDEETLASGSYYLVQAYQNLLEYERNSDKIELEFVDLVSNPTYVSQYPELELNSYDILIESDAKKEVISLPDMYEYDSSGSSITASKVEQMTTNAIAAVTSEETVKVSVLEGYGEVGPEELTELLETNRFEVTGQSLLTENIDPEADIAILYAPQSDLEENSLTKISEWLNNNGEQGKSLFVFLDPLISELPNLEALLNEWGIGLGEGYAFEANSNRYYDKFYYPIAQYADMDYAANMSTDDLTIMALCRPLDVLFASRDNYETTTLLEFSATSGVAKLGDTKVSEDMVTGNVKGMVLSSHRWYGTEVTTSNILVSGSALAFSGSLVSGSTFANADYILGVFRKLGNQDNTLNIVQKNLTTATHAMTSAQAVTTAAVFMMGIPVMILAAGVVVWVRRRHL